MSLTYDDLEHDRREREAATVTELLRQLKSARDWAVKLENENAALARHVAVQSAAYERYKSVVRGCTNCRGGAA